jgi:DNA-directed RNA polymerase specialized sigma subunit
MPATFAAALKIVKKRDSKRKEHVLADLGKAKRETQKQVAQKHGISERTVRRIKHKLGQRMVRIWPGFTF